jgi:uncharacterized protein (DUF2267 family)
MPKHSDDDKATEAVAIAVIKPPPLVAPIQAVIDTVNVSASVIAMYNPEAGVAVRSLAVLGGWIYNRYKADRVKPALQAVAELLEKTRSEYVKKEEFADFLQDALRRIADHPDAERRQALRSILESVIVKPRDHITNRRFLRLADELPVAAWKVLTAVQQAGAASHGELIEGKDRILARHAGLSQEQLEEAMEYLATEQILDRRKFNTSPMGAPRTGMFTYLLTTTGTAFLQDMKA